MNWPRGVAALDAETTGTDPRTARLVTVARAMLRGDGTVQACTRTLVDAGVEIPAEATAIHGITTEQVRAEGVPIADVLDQVARWLLDCSAEGRPVAAFNVRYDWTVLTHEASRLGHQLPRTYLLDPMLFDRVLDKWRKGPRKLADVCRRYGVELEAAHEAGADAVAAARVLQALAQEYPTLARVSLAELDSLQAIWFEAWRVDVNRYWERKGDTKRASPGWPLDLGETLLRDFTT